MPTSRPFAYNPSLTPIAGTTQVGSLAVGVSDQDYAAFPGGVEWWMGPDEDPGYVVAYHRDSIPNSAFVPTGGSREHPYFMRTVGRNESVFYHLVDGINPGLNGVTESVSWLNSNGYWHNYDGAFTPSVRICSQVWASANLAVTTYRNGDPIPEVNNAVDWSNLTTGAYCHVNGNSANDAAYGLIYNQYAAVDPRGLGPVGWRIPNAYDLLYAGQCFDPTANFPPGSGTLISSTAGGPLKQTGTSLWAAPNAGATNSSGFSGVGSGIRLSNGSFAGFGTVQRIWSTSYGSTNGLPLYFGLVNTGAQLYYFSASAKTGASIRLIMD